MSTRSINTNISSQRTQRRLSVTTERLRQSFERLSSGLRINKASDDAAGLAIGSSLRADSRVLSQAVRNINDSISLYAIADGAAEQLSLIVTRIRELATQSSNGVQSNSQRSKIDQEAQALRSEYNRIVETVEFNGLQLLKRDLTTLSVQAGYGAIDLAFADLGTSLVNDGTFKAASAIAPSNFSHSEVYDVNGDGALDIVAGGSGSSIAVYLGNNDGTFRASVSYGSGNGAWMVHGRDINGDGITDIGTVSEPDDTFSFLLGNSDGSFKARLSFAGGNNPNHMVTHDFNGDGRIDVASGALLDGKLMISLGNGDGTFNRATSFSLIAGAFPISMGDFNGDGAMDIVSGAATGSQVAVVLGNSNGTFKAPSLLFVGTNVYGTAVADVNRDGNEDVIANGWQGDHTLIFFGNGNGTFNDGISYDVGQQPTDVLAQDIDGDGFVEILTVGLSDDVSVLMSNGDGTYKAFVSFAAGVNPSSVKLADMNDDGVLDLITGGDGGGHILLGNGFEIPSLAAFSLQTQQDSLTAMEGLQRSLSNISNARGAIGSSLSRLSVAAANLTTTGENYESAASQIMDADLADESAALTRNSILQQAASAILAQANQLPALVLQLL